MIRPDRYLIPATFGGLIAIGIAVGAPREPDRPSVAQGGRDAGATKAAVDDVSKPGSGRGRVGDEPDLPALELDQDWPDLPSEELKQPSWMGLALRQLGVILSASRIRWLAARDGPGAVAALAEGRVRAARERLSVLWAFASEGTVSTNRYLDASRELMEAEAAAATSRAEAISAVRRHLDRLSRFLHNRLSNQAFGHNIDSLIIAEARDAHAQAALDLARMRRQVKR